MAVPERAANCGGRALEESPGSHGGTGPCPCREAVAGEWRRARTILPTPALRVTCDAPGPDAGCGVYSEDHPAPHSLLPAVWTRVPATQLTSRPPSRGSVAVPTAGFSQGQPSTLR